MLSSIIILPTIFLGAVVSAAAVPAPAPAPAPANIIPRTLTENDIIIWGKDGRVEVMDKASYTLLSKPSRPSSDPDCDNPPRNNTVIRVPRKKGGQHSKTLETRCDKQTIFTMYPVSTFLNWDVAMSSIVHATTATTTIAVTQGYSISNTVSVGVSSQLTLVKDFLSATLSIDYSQTWTSTYSAAYSFAVPQGKYAAVVSNPATTRQSGHVDVGCIGDEGVRTKFQADSYASKSYDNLAWVDGVISLCTGDTYPLKRCMGEGTL